MRSRDFHSVALWRAILLFSPLLLADGGLASSKRQRETLVFADEFDNFDLSVWKHDITMGGGGNWEFQYYTNNRSNSFVENGVLHLLPTLTADTIGEESVTGEQPYTMSLWGLTPADQCTSNAYYGCERSSDSGSRMMTLNPIQSAKVSTSGSFHMKYGRVEVEAKLPAGDWIWPAIWMLPAENAYGSWPASGEIDIMESRGNAIQTDCSQGGTDASTACRLGNSEVSSTLHWGPFWQMNRYWKTTGSMTLDQQKSFAEDFHIFGLAWDEDGMYTYVDDEHNRVMSVDFGQSFWDFGEFGNLPGVNNPWVGRPNAAPFDQGFYLIFNVAVGGVNGFFDDETPGKPWKNTDVDAAFNFWQAKDEWYPTWKGRDAALQVKSVKVWETPGGEHFQKGCTCPARDASGPDDGGRVPGPIPAEAEATFRFMMFATIMNSIVLLTAGAAWGMACLRRRRSAHHSLGGGRDRKAFRPRGSGSGYLLAGGGGGMTPKNTATDEVIAEMAPAHELAKS